MGASSADGWIAAPSTTVVAELLWGCTSDISSSVLASEEACSRGLIEDTKSLKPGDACGGPLAMGSLGDGACKAWP